MNSLQIAWWPVASVADVARPSPGYEPRSPADSVLYQIVRDRISIDCRADAGGGQSSRTDLARPLLLAATIARMASDLTGGSVVGSRLGVYQVLSLLGIGGMDI